MGGWRGTGNLVTMTPQTALGEMVQGLVIVVSSDRKASRESICES